MVGSVCYIRTLTEAAISLMTCGFFLLLCTIYPAVLCSARPWNVQFAGRAAMTSLPSILPIVSAQVSGQSGGDMSWVRPSPLASSCAVRTSRPTSMFQISPQASAAGASLFRDLRRGLRNFFSHVLLLSRTVKIGETREPATPPSTIRSSGSPKGSPLCLSLSRLCRRRWPVHQSTSVLVVSGTTHRHSITVTLNHSSTGLDGAACSYCS